MSHNLSVWLVLFAAVVGANLPFFNNRWLAVIPHDGRKTLWMHVAELVVCYLLVGGIGLALEQSGGQIYPQGWEFYATTAALFLTLAFPGFVYRYLFLRRG